MVYLKSCIIVLLLSFIFNNIYSQPSDSVFTLGTGEKVRVDIYKNGIFRIQLNKEGVFNQSLMERYEQLNTQMTKEPVTTSQNDSAHILETTSSVLLLNKKNGSIVITEKTGGRVLKKIQFNSLGKDQVQQLTASINKAFGDLERRDVIIGDTAKGVGGKKKNIHVQLNSLASIVNINLEPNERLYGAGAASRKNIQHRGEVLRNWATYQQSDMATPFIMSTHGWGIYNNTTRINYFDVGKFDKDNLLVYNADADIDFFLFLGKDMYDILDKYTLLTGRASLLPAWGYGMAFGGNMKENQFNVMDNAVRFREEKIPCDLYWLEPQWMAKYYDSTTSKSWNQDRFPGEVYWQEKTNPDKYEQPYLFIARLHKLGFKLALWLVIDHDLSIQAEDDIAKKNGKPLSGKEHWFEHLTKFVDQGVDGFKLDPGRTLDEHPDRKYYNGRTDKEMHNMNQVLMPKHMYTTFKNHTGRRSFHHYCGAWAGTQRWAASTAGDNGGGKEALYDQLNLSMSGFINTAVDVMEVTSRTFDHDRNMELTFQGLHFGFLLPWTQINSWYALHHPWYLSPREKESFRYYAQLRNSLHPYIYSGVIEGHLSGKPLLRAMPLEYPDDPVVENMASQYMFGPSLLVGVFSDSVYLPKGNWINFWTNKKAEGGQTVDGAVPENRGGALFIKAGAIIPFKKVSQYIGEFPNDSLTIKVYPGSESSYTLRQDDGISFAYEKDSIASTTFECSNKGNSIQLSIHPTKGSYKGMPAKVVYNIEMFTVQKPKKVALNGKVLSQWKWKKGILNVPVQSSLTKSELNVF